MEEEEERNPYGMSPDVKESRFICTQLIPWRRRRE